jgi:YesN/AraC family two-component response regulator
MALIMIVDDDPHIQLALRQIAESAGHNAIEACNGHDAIEMYGEYHPDLVITDIFMPQTDGIETIRAIRRRNSNAKIIAISGGYVGSGWNYLGSVMVLGADLALQKPFTVSQLTTSIELLLARPTPRLVEVPSQAAVAG